MLVYNTVASMTGYPVYMDLWYLMFAKVGFFKNIFKKQIRKKIECSFKLHGKVFSLFFINL